MTAGRATPPATTTTAAQPVWARQPSAAARPPSRSRRLPLTARTGSMIDPDQPVGAVDQGEEMRHAFMSIRKAFGTYSEGMTRVAERTEPWDPGACRRR